MNFHHFKIDILVFCCRKLIDKISFFFLLSLTLTFPFNETPKIGVTAALMGDPIDKSNEYAISMH